MKTIFKIYVRLVTALLPFLFLPLIIDSFGFGKMWILGVLLMIGLLLWIVGGIINRDEFKIYWTPTLLMVFLWLVWAVVSFVKMPVGLQMRTLISTTGLTSVLLLFGMVFLWTQTSDEAEANEQLKWLTASGLVVAVTSLIVFLIPTSKLPILLPKTNPMLAIDQNWSLMGSLLGEFMFLLILAAMWIKKMVLKMKEKENYIASAVILAVVVLVVFLDGFRIIKSGWGFLDWKNSWIIAVESLKQNPIFGVGIGNFVEAFYWWRGVGFNASPNWASVYSISGNWLTQVWSETGLVGLVLVLVLVWRTIKSQHSKINKIIATIAGIAILALPFNWIALLFWLWLITIFGAGKKNYGQISLKVGNSGINAGPAFLFVAVLLGVVWAGNWWGKIMLGEVNYRNSLVAASKNDGSGTYNLQIKAIALNENYPEYRRAYSQTNLALALSLLSNKDITEEDKQKAVTLVQQAVREGKATVALDNLNPGYWSNLAVIYKQLVGVIDGSADWAVQAYSQAGVLDTVNPALRLDFGGLLYALGSYDQADRLFEQSVTLKGDLANSWYNWSYTAKQLNKVDVAVSRLTQALTLVPAGSGDYEKASQELVTWKKELEVLLQKQKDAQAQAAKEALKPETLTNPAAIPTTNKEVSVPATGMEPPKVEPTPVLEVSVVPTQNP
jgi:Tfp pilus assembly protein PilF